ncbi:MAG: ATP-binding protein [Bacteroidales bacterium]|nr:ATP-binding protein [Bacteroidales bacterium]
MYKRPQYQILRKRIKERRKFIQVLLGPRQVGKTTLIKQVLQEIETPSHYANADAVSAPGGIWIEQQWEIVRTIKKQKGAAEIILVIDEIQKIPEWSEFVKAQWDRDSFDNNNIKVVLLGSASLLLQKGLSESLTGRYETIPMMHWAFNEMNLAFGFSPEQFVWFGGYPGAALLVADESRWKQYILESLVEPVIMKDILMMTRVDKPALLKNIFELACAYSGQILSLNKMLGQLQDAGNTTTLSHYLNLLSNAAMVTGIEKLYIEKLRQKSSIPKLQVFNTALLTVQTGESFDKIQLKPELWGRHVESAVGAHLLNYSQTANFRVFYWRHRNNEIDFVVEQHNNLIGLEVKSGKKQKAKGMHEFKKLFSPKKVLLIGDTGMPWQEFLKLNPAELF